mmetsp:Transcript_59439/g.191263  ORF Transcript_59439/g.191263 Transcript_59439/m.191263 type:complete len:359 (+) Transcript_59439:519-1595(+)
MGRLAPKTEMQTSQHCRRCTTPTGATPRLSPLSPPPAALEGHVWAQRAQEETAAMLMLAMLAWRGRSARLGRRTVSPWNVSVACSWRPSLGSAMRPMPPCSAQRQQRRWRCRVLRRSRLLRRQRQLHCSVQKQRRQPRIPASRLCAGRSRSGSGTPLCQRSKQQCGQQQRRQLQSCAQRQRRSAGSVLMLVHAAMTLSHLIRPPAQCAMLRKVLPQEPATSNGHAQRAAPAVELLAMPVRLNLVTAAQHNMMREVLRPLERGRRFSARRPRQRLGLHPPSSAAAAQKEACRAPCSAGPGVRARQSRCGSATLSQSWSGSVRRARCACLALAQPRRPAAHTWRCSGSAPSSGVSRSSLA